MSYGRAPVFSAVALLLLLAAPPSAASVEERMVAEQIEARGVDDPRVLDAMRRVPRAAFVPEAERARAHADRPLPIGHEQTISQPYMVALMTQLLGVQPGHRVLEIGTGSGYQAAVLGLLVREVYSVEIVPELAARARLALTRQGYRNVHVKQGDGRRGWREYAPFDRIIVTAAGTAVPTALVEQLVEGGVLIMPVGERDEAQTLVRGVKRDGKLRARPVTEVRFVPLTGGAAQPAERAPGAAPVRPVPPPHDAPPPAGDVSEEDLSSAPAPGRSPRRVARGRDPRARDARAWDRPGESRPGASAAGRSPRGGV